MPALFGVWRVNNDDNNNNINNNSISTIGLFRLVLVIVGTMIIARQKHSLRASEHVAAEITKQSARSVDAELLPHLGGMHQSRNVLYFGGHSESVAGLTGDWVSRDMQLQANGSVCAQTESMNLASCLSV